MLHCSRRMQKKIQCNCYCNLTLLFIFNFDSAVSVLLCELTGRIKIISLGEASSIARVHGAEAGSWRRPASACCARELLAPRHNDLLKGRAVRPRPIFLLRPRAIWQARGLFGPASFAVLAASHSAMRRKRYRRWRAAWRRPACFRCQQSLGIA